MDDKLCFVQFLHPGGEHGPDALGAKSWTSVDAGHARKFLQTSGRYVTRTRSEPCIGVIEFWGEWEAPSTVEPIADPLPDGPRWRHRPFWSPMASYQGLQNTDPFVFDDRFHYTGCLQHTKHGPTQLRRLARGSVILFGSKRPRRPEFTIDTVFVVADFVDHTRGDYRRKLAQVVSPTYAAVTLGPWYGNLDGCSAAKRSRSHRLYLGATFDAPVDGMYSFFPCRPTGDASPGFVRPAITIPGVITPTMTQNKRLNPQEDVAAIKPLWDEVVRQVFDRGLALGIHADLPDAVSNQNVAGEEMQVGSEI